MEFGMTASSLILAVSFLPFFEAKNTVANYILVPPAEGAGEVSYYIINDETAEMRFTMDTTRFTARIKPSAGFEDISGMYYDWTATNDTWKVQHCDARTMSYISKTEDDAMVTLWYDAAPGLMYSLSAAGNDLNGLDLPVLADQIYIPTQGNAG
jgi:hypothetical protein